MRIQVLTALLFVSIVLVGGVTVATAQDTLRPEISSWGIDGNAKGGESFIAWANVSDASSGVRNVSLIVQPNVGPRLEYPLESNGSLFTNAIPPLESNHTHTLFIKAFDMANNSATSYSRVIDRRPVTNTTIDPAVTAPVVIGSSLVLMVIVITGAWLYDRRSIRRNLAPASSSSVR